MSTGLSLSADAARRVLVVGGTRKDIPEEYGPVRHVEAGSRKALHVPDEVRHVVLWTSRCRHTLEYALKSAKAPRWRLWPVRGGRHSLLVALVRIIDAEEHPA